MQCDSGSEFRSAFAALLAKRDVQIRYGRVNIHKDQGIIERFNQTVAESLFGYQYAQEMKDHDGRSTEWVLRLPEVLAAMNLEETRLIGKKRTDTIKQKSVTYF